MGGASSVLDRSASSEHAPVETLGIGEGHLDNGIGTVYGALGVVPRG